MMDKKGAIEFSMTTIMVIIIGVAVLALGIAWVRGAFTNISDITEDAFESAKEQLRAELTSQSPMGISPSTISLKPGESTTIAVGFLNAVSPAVDIKETLEVEDVGNIVELTFDNEEKTLTTGEVFNWRVIVKATGDIGNSGIVRIKATGDQNRERQLVVNIK